MLNSITFFENCAIILDNVEKYGTDGQAKDDNKALEHCYQHTLRYIIVLVAFCGNSSRLKAPQCYVIRTLTG
jgi:hypothetical protein